MCGRMPVILEPDQIALWLGEKGKGAAKLMQATPENTLQFYRVGREINSREHGCRPESHPLKSLPCHQGALQ